MDSASQIKLARLVRSQRTAALGTLSEGSPLVSLVLYAASVDFSRYYILASTLAQHTQDFLQDPRGSLMIAESDQGTLDPQTLARLSMRGEINALPQADAAYNEAKDRYLQKYPASSPLFQFSDFSLYCFQPQTARYVAGFAQAFNLSLASLIKVSAVQPA